MKVWGCLKGSQAVQAANQQASFIFAFIFASVVGRT